MESKLHYTAVIVGAGPGGLACANILAKNGVRTLVIEKKTSIGHKVCAGGITWSGLIKIVPENLIERSFPQQFVSTKYQKVCISSPDPIIATVDRRNLGEFMSDEAKTNGAEILTSTFVRTIHEDSLTCTNTLNGEDFQIQFKYLIGGDGSHSIVRRHLGLPLNKCAGIGINYQIPGSYEKMEWHLDSTLFKSGYGWIFPHKESISIGAYVDKSVMSAKQLKKNLNRWALKQHFDLRNHKCSAEFINFDYQGWDFGNIFLLGDAAGLASALTGEGIYPAIISGETIAEKILNPHCDLTRINRMIRKQKNFRRMIGITGRNRFASSFFAELGLLLLRMKILTFNKLEMGH